MAVIVVGKKQPKSQRIVCSHCGCTLEYLLEDVRFEGRMKYVDCASPRCKKQVFLGTS
jgi:transcription initiation factor TFIIIB Brf1 subunit/transcription initiation factor TFIIB